MTAAEGGTLRLLSYNVLSLRMSEETVAAVITACASDIVCLQEAPRFLFWRRRLERLAAATGLRVVAGHRRAGAVAILVAPGVEVLAASVTRLPGRIGRHRRGVATALLGVHGRRLAVASVHLSLYADERAGHLPLILRAAERYEAAVVIAGDINEQESDGVWRQLAERYQDAYAVAPEGGRETFSAREPHKRIDGIFVSHSLAVLGCGVPGIPGLTEASDHRPVLARISF